MWLETKASLGDQSQPGETGQALCVDAGAIRGVGCRASPNIGISRNQGQGGQRLLASGCRVRGLWAGSLGLEETTATVEDMQKHGPHLWAQMRAGRLLLSFRSTFLWVLNSVPVPASPCLAVTPVLPAKP